MAGNCQTFGYLGGHMPFSNCFALCFQAPPSAHLSRPKGTGPTDTSPSASIPTASDTRPPSLSSLLAASSGNRMLYTHNKCASLGGDLHVRDRHVDEATKPRLKARKAA